MRRLARSIRLRLLAFALLGTLVAMSLAGLGLAALFERHLERRVGHELDAVIVQLAGNLRVAPDGQLELRVEPNDPRFHRPLSGLYWQVRDEAPGREGATLRARSLWDAELASEAGDVAPGQSWSHRATAPDGKDMLQHDRRLVLATSGTERPVTISVAVERSEIASLRAGFAADLAPGLVLLGLLILAGAWFQVGAGLRPLGGMREGVARIRAGEERRLDAEGPDEISPLVAELNALLEAQEREILRARDRAADLAHGLRTPLTALAGDVERLRRAGEGEIAADVASVGDQMRRIVERELARARSRHAAGKRVATPMAAVAGAVVRTLERTPAAETVAIALDIPDGVSLPMPADDIAEILGNLAENAVRAARSRVRIAGGTDETGSTWLSVEDDGPGADPARMARLSGRGERADENGGAGLGLAIVGDILEAHGGTLGFDRAPLGGLRVTIRMA